MKKRFKKSVLIPALKVDQWLRDWDTIKWDAKGHRRKPEHCFYVFSLSARQLRALSGVYRRNATSRTGLQRAHEPKRSMDIAKYVKFGYPWSDLTEAQRKDKAYNHLQKPGWLPTAIVVNILTKDDTRDGEQVADCDLVTIKHDQNGRMAVHLPLSFKHAEKWKAKQNHPIEVIDGQHRLLAFDDKAISEDYELPVVAFYGLDISWQAYLFWTINIKPKRINPSLAYDLYPLLRTEEWLERFEGHRVYREIRAQELVETLWSEPRSAWHQRINMLGERGGASVTQAAWVRALLKTYVKSFEGRTRNAVGGLFGAPVGQDEIVIPWNRSQQGALLVYLWNEMRDAVHKSKEDWAKDLRNLKKQEYKRRIDGDPAFTGPHSLLNNDQGITVVLNISNDLLFMERDTLDLEGWKLGPETSPLAALTNLVKQQKAMTRFVSKLATSLAKFDWRSSAAIGLSEVERTKKLSFRGGSGYKEFRRQVLRHLYTEHEFGAVARQVYKKLGYAKEDAKHAKK